MAPDALSLRTRNPRVAWRARGTGHAGAEESAAPWLAPFSFLPGFPSVALLPLQLSFHVEEVERELPWWSRWAHLSFVTLRPRRPLVPWQSWGSRAAGLHKRVAVIDRSPSGAWGPWGPGWARRTPQAESHAGISRLPLLPFQSVHPGATRPSGEANLSLVPGPPIWTRGSSEARLTLGSFLGRGQWSAVGAEDCAWLALLALGSREARLAFGAQVTLWPGRSGEACKPRAALGARHARHRSV